MRRLFHLAVGGIFLFMLGPLLVVVAVSFNGGNVTVFPPRDVSMRWYASALANRAFVSAVINSVALGATAAMLATCVGVAAALAIDRWRFPGRDALQSILLSPLVVPGVVIGIALLVSLTSVGLRDSASRLVIAHLLICFPYSVRTVLASLARIEPSLAEAAVTLGAAPRQVFWNVTLPLIRPGIAAGAIFAFVISLDNVPISIFLIDAHTATLPIAIMSYLEYNFDPSVAALSSMLILAACLLALLLERVFGLRRVLGF